MTLITEAPARSPVETVTPIKPSEALRLGRLSRPERSPGYWFQGDTAACALGAIHLGWGGAPSPDWESEYATTQRLASIGLPDADDLIGGLFDDAEFAEKNGDTAVLAYLEERGL